MEYILGKKQQLTRCIQSKLGIRDVNSKFYRYLWICAAEQRGTHSIAGDRASETDKFTDDGEQFLVDYVREINADDTTWTQTDEEKKFLTDMVETVKNDKNTLTVAQTRDCQVLEMGRQGVKLSLSALNSDNIESIITFWVWISQDFGKMPISAKQGCDIQISYKTCDQNDIKKHGYTRTKEIAHNRIDINDDIFLKKGVGALFYPGNDYIVKPQLTTNVCVIS